MSLNYSKVVAKKHDGDTFWAAYADLYTMLSVIFLMLFITASLRSGTSAIQKAAELQKIAREADDLREQNQVYAALKEDYLERQASQKEQEVYKNLMDKLTLLQEEAKKEKEDLRKQATENEQKEVALNQYQQIIRNIINANMLAKSTIQKRDKVIDQKKQAIASLDAKVGEQAEAIRQNEAEIVDKKEQLLEQQQVLAKQEKEIRQRTEQVDGLERDLAEKQQQITANNESIQTINDALAKKINELKTTQDKAKTSKAKLLAAIKTAEAESAAKIKALEEENENVSGAMAKTEGDLKAAQGKLDATEKALGGATAERDRLAGELEATGKRLGAEMEGMKAAFDKEMGEKEKAFRDGLAKEKLSGDEKAARERAFAEEAKGRADEMGKALAALGDQIKDAEGKLAKADAAEKKYKDYIDSLEKDKVALAEDLKKSRDQLRDKREIAKALKEGFKKAGIDANVDERTGEVTMNFPEYFDTGKSDLKDKMVSDLKKLMPVYASSLFDKGKIAEKIASVDIVGFASPTYKGKYVDPESLTLEDRAALDYNLDLSYNRAKSIFNFAFDTKKLKFKHQKKMLPLVKVTGRSYLAEGAKGKDVKNGLSVKEYCAKYDCVKDQKVIIKFNLKD